MTQAISGSMASKSIILLYKLQNAQKKIIEKNEKFDLIICNLVCHADWKIS